MNLLVVITPAYNEAENLPELYRRLGEALDGTDLNWCWLLVDDCSSDGTPAFMSNLSSRDASAAVKVGAIRLAQRTGSHRALYTGLRFAAGLPAVSAVALLAADLQNPPEALTQLIARWRQGAGVVLAGRDRPLPGPVLRRIAAQIIYVIVRILIAPKQFPRFGADMVLLDRPALETLLQDRRPIGNLFIRIARLNSNTASIPVVHLMRYRGKSGWSRTALIRLAVATIGEAIGWRPGAPVNAASIAQEIGWAIAVIEKAQTKKLRI